MQKHKKKIIEEAEDEEEEANQAEENEPEYHQIELLQENGINNSDINKLKEAGFNSLESLSYTARKNLTTIKGFSEAKIDKIIKIVDEILNYKIQPSTVALQKRKKLTRITSGSKELDTLLGGGFESDSITELFGEFRTGKTQICHTLCVTCQLPKSDGGGEGKAIYIDTEGTFRPEKLALIAERFGLDPKETIENVYYARAYNSDHQQRLLVQVCALMCEQKFSLLIVDSAKLPFIEQIIPEELN